MQTKLSVNPIACTGHGMCAELLPEQERALGPNHPIVLTTRGRFAYLTGEMGEPREALRLFAEPQAWLTLLAGAIGFGGMFALYAYIAKVVTEVGGLADGAVPVFLLAFGVGMVTGTYVAGPLAAMHTPGPWVTRE